MKLREVTALLVLWIAIKPPIIWVKDHAVVYTDAPTSSWLRHGDATWPSELACENWKAEVLSEQGIPGPEGDQFKAIRCVPIKTLQK